MMRSAIAQCAAKAGWSGLIYVNRAARVVARVASWVEAAGGGRLQDFRLFDHAHTLKVFRAVRSFIYPLALGRVPAPAFGEILTHCT